MDEFKENYPYEYELFEEFGSKVETDLWPDGEIGFNMKEKAITEFADFAIQLGVDFYNFTI